MKIEGKKLTREQFAEYVKAYNFGTIPPDSIVVHHTWKPKKQDWSGVKSINGLRNYYESVKQWPAGPHLFIAEDGIWLFTPMNTVGIHAGAGNATWQKWGRKYTGWRDWDVVKYLKGYSIGIEVVGDYDEEVWTGETKENTLATIRTLMDVLKIPKEKLFFHRDFSSKSCPGSAIKKDWLFRQLETREEKADWSMVSPWAKDAWAWQIENDLDRTVHPHENVTAEWVFAILKKLQEKKGK